MTLRTLFFIGMVLYLSACATVNVENNAYYFEDAQSGISQAPTKTVVIPLGTSDEPVVVTSENVYLDRKQKEDSLSGFLQDVLAILASLAAIGGAFVPMIIKSEVTASKA